jgi:hypothetical protein
MINNLSFHDLFLNASDGSIKVLSVNRIFQIKVGYLLNSALILRIMQGRKDAMD